MIPTLEAIHANCDEVGDCWEWRGALDGSAPVMRPAGTRKLVAVRRLVLTLTGKNPEGKLACAKCQNRRCVAPHHAIGLTRTQLQQRTAQITQYGKNPARSAKMAKARRARSILSMEQVLEMRASGLSSRQAAKKYGIGQTAASDAIAGRTWKEYSSPFAGLFSGAAR